MKTTILILLAALPWMTTTVVAAEDADRIALTIICDTRWSCGGALPELRTLARQSFGGLRPGDCIEILTAHPSRPRLRLPQTTYQDTVRQAVILNGVLAGVHAGFLTDAKISSALTMALSRLERICAEEGCQKAVVVILSNGHLSNGDVEAVLRLAPEFHGRSWPLYITGDRGANRNLLIAGNRGTINLVSIGDANPALWLREARKSLESEREKDTRDAAPEVATAPPSILAGTQSYSPSRQSYPAPDPPDLILGPGQGAPRPGVRTRTEVEVTISDGPIPAPANGAVESPPSRESSEIPTLIRRPKEPTQALESDESAGESAPAQPTQPMGIHVRRWIGRFWSWLAVGLSVALLLGAAGYLVTRDREKAKQIRKKLQGYLKTKRAADNGMLVATIDGQTRHLGRLSRLRPFYIGSGAKNALRVVQKGISDRHLCLYQKAGRLMVQNLSRNPVSIAGTALEPKGKRGVALPVIIELTGDVKLRVALSQLKPGGIERSKEHGQIDARQKAAPAVSH